MDKYLKETLYVAPQAGRAYAMMSCNDRTQEPQASLMTSS